MIFVTGGTGFIGRALLRQLLETGQEVRVMIRPSRRSPRLPKGLAIDVAVASLADERSIRAALKGIDVIVHLAGAEWQGRNADLLAVDMQGTELLAHAAAEAKVKRLITVSHLGASRSSGYPVFKAKGVAEEHIRRSGVPYTILRSALVFGPEDHFTTSLASLLRVSPLFFPLPMSSRTVLQPLWVDDLVTALLWSLEDAAAVNRTYEIGGSEFFTARQIVETIMQASQRPHVLFELHPVLLRALIVSLESLIPHFPISSFWLDYIAVSRTCAVENLPQSLGLMPARFTYRLDYLRRKPWVAAALSSLSERTSETTKRVWESIRLFHP